MTPRRSWLVMFALAVACASVAYLALHELAPALALGAAGAAVARAVRGVVGATRGAALIAAAAGSLLATVCVVEFVSPVQARAALAVACAAFAIAELARAYEPDRSPWPLLGSAVLAAGLDPSFAALLVLAGVWWIRQPRRPRGAVAVPLLGALVVAAAVVAACVRDGMLAHAWAAWSLSHASSMGVLGASSGAVAMTTRFADALGPLAIVAMLAGLGLCTRRPRLVAGAMLACSLGGLLVAMRGGAATTAVFELAALAAAVAVGQLAALVRLPMGQVFVAITGAVLVVGGPAWALMMGN